MKYPDLPVIGLGGPIRIAINYRDHSITNHTKSGHSFHPGKVVRKIVQHGSDIYIQSEGSGIGGYRTINDTDGLMAFFWGRRDQKLVKVFEKLPIVSPQQPTASDVQNEEKLRTQTTALLDKIFPKYKNHEKTFEFLFGDFDGDSASNDVIIVWGINSYSKNETGYQGNGYFPAETGIYTAFSNKTNSSDWRIVSKNIKLFDRTGNEYFPIGISTKGEIKSSRLIVEQLSYSDNDPRCCPSVKKTATFIFKNGTFIIQGTPQITNSTK